MPGTTTSAVVWASRTCSVPPRALVVACALCSASLCELGAGHLDFQGCKQWPGAVPTSSESTASLRQPLAILGPSPRVHGRLTQEPIILSGASGLRQAGGKVHCLPGNRYLNTAAQFTLARLPWPQGSPAVPPMELTGHGHPVPHAAPAPGDRKKGGLCRIPRSSLQSGGRQ